MRDHIDELEARDVQVLIVDPHERYRVRHMLRTAKADGSGDAAFPVLADPASAVSALYGVAMQMRIHTEWSNRPAAFVIDRDGTIRFAQRATTYDDRPKVAHLMQVVRRLAALTPEKEKALLAVTAGREERPDRAAAQDAFTRKEFLRTLRVSKSGYTLVSLFHPSCTGCLTEAIALREKDRLWKDLGVHVIGLADTNLEEPLERFARASRANYRLERAPWIRTEFGVRFYPTLLVVDARGEVVFRAAEETDDPVGAAGKRLEKLVPRKETSTPR